MAVEGDNVAPEIDPSAGDAPKIRRETVLGETASPVVTGSDFTLTCSLTDLSDDGNDGDDPVAMARQLAQARLERLRAVQVVVGGEDDVYRRGALRLQSLRGLLRGRM